MRRLQDFVIRWFPIQPVARWSTRLGRTGFGRLMLDEGS